MARGSQATRPAPSGGRQAPGEGRGARGGALAQHLRSSAPSRYLFSHPKASGALLLGLFVFAYLWPVLVGGRWLTPNGVLYELLPWEALPKPRGIAGWTNGLLTDVPTADYPWRFLIRELLHAGTFPAWNPYVFDGIPLWSNPQTGLFSLFSLPLWILPLNYAIGVGAALKLWAAGFGTFLLVRELRLGFLPGLLAGVCFSFSAIDIVWLTHETLPAVAALLPWMLWLVERIYQARPPGRLGTVAGLAAASAIGLGGGHPGMQVHLMAAAGMYALLRAAFLPRGAGRGERLRPLGLAVGGLVLGAMLMGAMLLPEALSSSGTIGTLARSHGRGTLPGTQMPLSVLRTVLFPDWWGRPSSGEMHGGPVTQLSPGLFILVNYNERTLYAGAVGLLLALVGVAAPDRWRRKAPFVVLAALGLAIPLHFPGLYQLVTHLPLFDQVQNQRLHFVWALGMAVLAAFGLQAVLERPAGDRRRLAVGALVVGLGVFVLGIAIVEARGSSDFGHTLTHLLTGRDFRSAAVLRLASAVWYLVLAACVGAALLAARRWPERRAWIACGVVLLAAADMLHFAGRYQPMPPASQAIPPRTGAIRYLQRHRSEGRVLGIGGVLPSDWALTYGLRDIRGYDPPQPSLRFFRLWRVAESAQLDWTPFGMESLSPAAMQVASVLGARYVVTAPGTDLPVEGRRSLLPGLRVAYDGRDARVFVDSRAAPRAVVPRVVRVVSGEAEALAVVTEAGFDPRRDAVVEGVGGGAGAGAGAGTGARASSGGAVAAAGYGSASGSASVSDRSNGAEVIMHARLARPGLVVLNDDWTPGWTVRVDGHAARALRVNDVMRGVEVPAGAHVVEWSYRVPGLRAGAVLSLLALLAVAALMLAGRRAAVARRA